MTRSAVLIIIVAVLAAGGVTGAAVFYGTAEYSITYELDGGVNSDDNPATYKLSAGTELHEPTKEGYVFLGWYSDPELTVPVYSIKRGTMGDITLYAAWEVSKVGTSLTFGVSGTVKSVYMSINSGTTYIDGTVTFTYLSYRFGQGYLMDRDESGTYYVRTWLGGTRVLDTYSESDTYWSGDSDTEWVRGTDKTITAYCGPVECEMWTTSDGTETQYIGKDDGILYLAEYESRSADRITSLTYELKETNLVVLDESFNVSVYLDGGVSVSGSGTSDAYSKVTLTASGDFSGWYTVSGTLLSTDRTYTIDTLVSDITLCAHNSNWKDRSFDDTDVSITVDLTDVTWRFTDGEEKEIEGGTLTYTFSSAGSYTLLYEGTDASGDLYLGLFDIMVDGYVEKVYSWEYQKKTYSTTLDILYSDYLAYKEKTISRSQGSESHDLEFVTYEDGYIIELAGKLHTMASEKSMDELQEANFILCFVQYIEYEYDSVSMGTEEYWKYALETLFDEGGDCEDTSILYCAIMKALDYDCALLLFSGHMAAGVDVPGDPGSYFQKNGSKYYYCETTATGYTVGKLPSNDYKTALKVIPVV